VYVGDTKCGQLPEVTETSKKYTITCDTPINGSFVKIIKKKSMACLALGEVTAYGPAINQPIAVKSSSDKKACEGYLDSNFDTRSL